MRGLAFASSDEDTFSLDIETATLRFGLRPGTQVDRSALERALKKAGFELGKLRVENGAGNKDATEDADPSGEAPDIGNPKQDDADGGNPDQRHRAQGDSTPEEPNQGNIVGGAPPW